MRLPQILAESRRRQGCSGPLIFVARPSFIPRSRFPQITYHNKERWQHFVFQDFWTHIVCYRKVEHIAWQKACFLLWVCPVAHLSASTTTEVIKLTRFKFVTGGGWGDREGRRRNRVYFKLVPPHHVKQTKEKKWFKKTLLFLFAATELCSMTTQSKGKCWS